MKLRTYRTIGRGTIGRFKAYSLSPKRYAYMRAGEPYGRNRKGLKRWLRELKAGLTHCGGCELCWPDGEPLPEPDAFDDDSEPDEMEIAMGECGLGADYEGCMLAGTEYCEFECPFNN